ncbi:MAG: phosphotransferase, partial [Muribaculaceae bacterium]|nr:phosphotransferase [Muribaculaceae bacterium]
NNIPVPEGYGCEENKRKYYQQDLGDVCLLDVIRGETETVVSEYVCKAIDALVQMQTVDLSGLEESQRHWDYHISPEFGRRSMMWDLNYFKYEFVKPSGIDIDEWQLENEFERLVTSLSSYPASLRGFMMRDFQSRNVMVRGSDVYLIDYQGGRVGPMLYDIVSMLWQARAGFDTNQREVLLQYYADKLSALRDISPEEILENIGEWVLLRLLQVLGAYGLRGLVERKARFVESIPVALSSVAELLSGDIGTKYPYIADIIKRLCDLERFQSIQCHDGLTVSVFSFSYMKGYPEDLSGNGGGFMFDCRALHNPGRYEEYKYRTGRDEDVKQFLESRGEVQPFISSVENLVFPAVERYIQRGFKSLQVGFGCTGGQHRSVYCAQSVAEDIARLFPAVRVILRHREQDITEVYNNFD